MEVICLYKKIPEYINKGQAEEKGHETILIKGTIAISNNMLGVRKF
jgi:hypothetical protein